MTFYEALEQVVTLLQRHGRISYRTLTRQFQLDEAYLEDLKAELVNIQRVAVDHYGTMLAWTGDALAVLPFVTSALGLEYTTCLDCISVTEELAKIVCRIVPAVAPE